MNIKRGIDESFNPTQSSTPKKLFKTSSSKSDLRSITPGTAGIIKSINVQNFMCHDHFEMVFNPRINFISGRNGSGKSAIQTALIIGLAGDARATSRGTALASFIKENKNQATIQITLSNVGHRAFKPELYGNELTVIRILSKTSSFKIRSKNGKVYPVKKPEILAMVEKFQIQVTNPVAILNQNTARTFLNSTNPSHKFNLFMEATLFEDLLTKKAEAFSDLRIMRSIMTEKRKALESLEDELKKDQEKFKLIKLCDEAKEKKILLDNELVWSRVVESEKQLQELKEMKINLENDIATLQENYSNQAEKDKQMKEQIKELENSLIDQVKISKEYQNEINKTEEKRHSKLRELQDKNKKLDNIKKKIKGKESDNKILKSEIDDYQRKKEEFDEQKEQIKIKQDEYDNKFNDYAAGKKTLESDLENAKNAVQQIKSKISQKRTKLNEFQMIINQKEQRIRNSTSKVNNLSEYSSWMGTLVDQINEAYKRKRFSQLPKGPLGSYIKMKDEKWASLAELALGYSTLRMFVVNSRADEEVLQSIFKKVIPSGEQNPPVSCIKFNTEPFNIKEAEYNNVFSNLEITDTIVSNIIIELSNCQKVILIEDNKTAFELLSISNRVPRHTSMGYTLDGSKHFPNIGSNVYKTYSGNLKSRIPRYVQIEKASIQDQLKNEINELRQNMNAINNEIMSLNEELQKSQQHEMNVERQINGIKSKMMKLKDDLDKTVGDLMYDLPSEELQHEEFNDNLKQIEKLKKEFEETESELDPTKTLIEEYKNKLQELKAKLDEHESRGGELKKIEQLRTEYSNFKKDFIGKDIRIKDMLKQVEHKQKRIEEQQAIVQTHIEEASELVARDECENPRPMIQVEKDILEVQNLLERLNRSTAINDEISVFDLEERINDKQDALCKNKIECDVAEQLAQNIEKCLKRREQAYKLLLNQIIESTKMSFNSTLSCRGYSGELLIDLKNKSLNIHILPKKTQDAKLKDTASLSGGERSFSTVAFIMALWRDMAVPFFSMDEFDVFMDSVSRKFIIDLLLMSARGGIDGERQFLFLTPLDCSILDSSSDLTIHRMGDPERYTQLSQ